MTQETYPKDSPDHVKARWWRENVVKMSRPALGNALGYTSTAIYNIENNIRTNDKSMQRYKMACAGLVSNPKFYWK